MYSRSLDPRRISSPLPSHYGGSAFRSDGTPTSIPVRREHDASMRRPNSDREPPTSIEAEDTDSDEGLDNTNDIVETIEEAPPHSKEPNPDASPSPRKGVPDSLPVTEKCEDDHDAPFLTRLLGGFLPGIRDDDILLILLIFLLSREHGNEDVILLLAFLLFGK